MNTATRLERNPFLLEKLVGHLSHLPEEKLLLPPVLGLTPKTRDNIERDCGRRLFELAVPGGAPGSRLLYALRNGLLRKENVMLAEESRAVSLETGIPHRVSLTLGKLEMRTANVLTDSVVLCTGGPLTTFRQDGDELVEPLTGITCASLTDDLSDDLLSPQPALEASLPVDKNFQIDGFDGVYAAGAIGSGFGLPECVDSAWEVSRQL
jgi:hypothetical protein